MKTTNYALAALLIFGVAACENEETPMPQAQRSPMDLRLNKIEVDIQSQENARIAGGVESWMASVNESLAAQGLQLAVVETYSADGAGNTVFFNNRGNKQLGSDFVPGDPRRGGFTDIAYAHDGTEGSTASGLTQAQTDGAILSAMNTWDNVSCSGGLVLTNLGASPFDLGYVQAILGFGGSFFFTDLMHSGFLPGAFFDALAPGGSNFILGATFTFIWLDGSGAPTDIDNNGKSDVAFRDIYYNDAFSWAIGGNIDVETVALHEAGHGLSQGHFGKLFQTGRNGKFHFAPRAVMNAGYTGVQTSINETDNAGHCSNWEEWPNN